MALPPFHMRKSGHRTSGTSSLCSTNGPDTKVAHQPEPGQRGFQNLQEIATKYNRPLYLTLERLRAQGRVQHTEKSVWSSVRLKLHFSGLFETKKLAWSTIVIIANWFVIGMVSPLYQVFLSFYLSSRGAHVGDNSNYTVWRDYAINQIAGLGGPIIAGILVETKYLGRRGTLAIGALVTMVFQFGYTQITTPAQNVGVSAAISAASYVTL
jgi:hypothetical protein